ncbi:molybdopterin-dependent oxidoreductase [Salinivibrio socompensis]|uniref:molybdopterin-dependent oxidoreductase n=1 Tax=Salinivibrio socompensis TaxID=1510206 RepID=UPI00046F1DC9|nr:molybdopterin-dependent oxidoreductase [Salinivibrio socompensis]
MYSKDQHALAIPNALSALRVPVKLTLAINDRQRIEFDQERLSRLPVIELDTHTPWTQGLQKFKGVRLSTLLDHANVPRFQEITLRSMNRYQSQLAWDDIRQYQPIIAFERNGQPMTIRTLGPLWLIFPLDDHPQLQSERFHQAMVWQLTNIEIEP